VVHCEQTAASPHESPSWIGSDGEPPRSRPQAPATADACTRALGNRNRLRARHRDSPGVALTRAPPRARRQEPAGRTASGRLGRASIHRSPQGRRRRASADSPAVQSSACPVTTLLKWPEHVYARRLLSSMQAQKRGASRDAGANRGNPSRARPENGSSRGPAGLICSPGCPRVTSHEF
jgi:hypothetical protein